jgi:hypothetical protein
MLIIAAEYTSPRREDKPRCGGVVSQFEIPAYGLGHVCFPVFVNQREDHDQGSSYSHHQRRDNLTEGI